MKKILLINPEESRTIWTLSGVIDDEPLDIEMVYTVLKEGKYNVRIHDIQRDENEKIEDVIKEYKPNAIFINGVVKQVPFILEYIKLTKNIDKNIITIIGGSYAEYNYKKLYCEELDYVSRSYDPYVILNIIKYIDGKKIDLDSLNGLCYRKNEKWIETKIKPVDIQTLPIIDRTFFLQTQNEI